MGLGKFFKKRRKFFKKSLGFNKKVFGGGYVKDA
jgi:hypothetical protein